MDLVKNHFGAYGIGVEYAYTMVHGAPPTTYFPEYEDPCKPRRDAPEHSQFIPSSCHGKESNAGRPDSP